MHNDCTKLEQQQSLLRRLKLLIVPRFLTILYENGTRCVIFYDLPLMFIRNVMLIIMKITRISNFIAFKVYWYAKILIS